MKKKTAKSAGKKSAKSKSAAPTPARPAKLKQRVERSKVQEALQVTWLLKGKLKSAQIAYLRIGELLVRVRDKKLFSELKHPSLEDYAQQRLNLGRASLYRYVQVYDWVRESHSEWLEPKPKGFIPYFTDTVDLMWIEHTLANRKLTKGAKTELEGLKAKALEGKLKDGEVERFRQRGGRAPDGLKTFLSKVRLLRKRGSVLKNMPAEAVTLMDELIKIIDNALDIQPAK